MQFPVLDCDPIGELIHKCWYNQFPTIASLPVATKALLNSGEESKAVEEDGGESDAGNLTGNGASNKHFVGN